MKNINNKIKENNDMSENKMIGNVSGQLIGKVTYAKAVEKETKDGRKYEVWQLGVKLPSGCAVFISNNIWPATREKVGQKVNELENIITRFTESKEDIYVRLGLRPDKTTGENKYGRFSTYIDRNDKLSLKGEGFVDLIEHKIIQDENGEDKVELIFMNSKNGEYTVDFNKSEHPLIIKGYVAEISKDYTFIKVVDGKDLYPASWNLTVKEEIGKQLVIGQGYAFEVEFKKGEAIKQDETEQKNEFDFSADFTIESLSGRKKTEYSSDKLNVVAGGLLKGCSIKIENQGSTFGSTDPDDELPF